MSNVLIGIIGVILFIGLALAGALFLGPRFQESSNTSKASAITTVMKQVADATSLYELNEGVQLKAVSANQYAGFLAPGYLKSIPVLPHSGLPVQLIDHSGSNISGSRAVMYYSNIGTDAQAKAICREIEKGAGAADPAESQDPAKVASWDGWTNSHKRIGCLLNAYSGNYQAYVWF